jgi:hypothetical protein
MSTIHTAHAMRIQTTCTACQVRMQSLAARLAQAHRESPTLAATTHRVVNALLKSILVK